MLEFALLSHSLNFPFNRYSLRLKVSERDEISQGYNSQLIFLKSSGKPEGDNQVVEKFWTTLHLIHFVHKISLYNFLLMHVP